MRSRLKSLDICISNVLLFASSGATFFRIKLHLHTHITYIYIYGGYL